MESIYLTLAYSAGILAVLAPCALPMLPSFVSYYMNTENRENKLRSALGFGVTTVLGFLTVFTVIGILPSFMLNIVSNKIDLVTPFIGAILIFLGLGHLFSDFFQNIPTLNLVSPKGTGYRAFYLYGLGYGAASMSCSFPVFILLVLQSTTAGGYTAIITMFISYGLGAATILIPLSVALTYSKEIIYEKLVQTLPHLKTVNGGILILAGVYMILTYII